MDTQSDSCPFGHKSIKRVESVDVSDLKAAYHAQYDIDISPPPDDIHQIAFYRCAECEIGFFAPAITGSPDFYAKLSDIPWYYGYEKEEYQRASRRISPGQSVLEVGCGSGAFKRYLDPSCSYVGLEFNPRGIAAAQGAGIDVRSTSIESMAESHKETFDIVCSFQVVEHVDDPAGFIAACVACAKPGGTIIMSVPNDDAFVGAMPDNLLNMPPHHVTRWSEAVFWNIRNQLGLDLVAVEKETLSSGHRESYYETVATRALMRLLRIGRMFLFTGLTFFLLKRVTKIAMPALRIAFNDRRLLPVGHTILAIFKKSR